MLLVGVVLTVFVLAVLMLSKVSKMPRKSSLVSYASRPLMTPREREFFVLLRGALPADAEIHAQVSMGALIAVAKGARSERNRFDRKVLDFVVCAAGGLVLYAVELDDHSHAGKSAQRRDAVKSDICAAAGLRLVRYQSVRTDASLLLADFQRFAGVGDRVSNAPA